MIDVAKIFSNPGNYPIEITVAGYATAPGQFGVIYQHISDPGSYTSFGQTASVDQASITLTTVWGSIDSDEIVDTCSIAEENCGVDTYNTKIQANMVGSIGLIVWNLTNSSTDSYEVTFTYASVTGLTPSHDRHSKGAQIIGLKLHVLFW